MRIPVILLALASLSACHSQTEKAQAEVPPPITFEGALKSDAAAKLAHGERIASVLGCRGCHTPTLEGQRFYELYASNLTREIPKYSDAQLDRLMRHGEHPSGREVWGMPSEIFQHLDDADLAALTAYLRTLKPAGPPTGKPLPFEGEAKKLIDEGKIMPASKSVVRDAKLLPPDLGKRHALGRYITMVTCAECHGPELKGTPGDTPDLVVASAYSRAEFEKFLTTGVPSGNRKLKNDLMSMVAKSRFSKMTISERDAVYAYLKARAEQPQ
ncbi:MAG: c-type cytochrome [Sphingomicrobium sp.]